MTIVFGSVRAPFQGTAVVNQATSILADVLTLWAPILTSSAEGLRAPLT
jgi:hypothetical protein